MFAVVVIALLSYNILKSKVLRQEPLNDANGFLLGFFNPILPALLIVNQLDGLRMQVKTSSRTKSRAIEDGMWDMKRSVWTGILARLVLCGIIFFILTYNGGYHSYHTSY
ncbi:MAG: hypothetical protein Q4E47_01320 [Candidatus Saccharibacteria bacterium]|nr:hypothetical protein [Candidatus Saccharibacteria bacterium]